MTVKVVHLIAQALDAIHRIESGASVPLMGVDAALDLHRDRLAQALENMPHGSGFDGDCGLNGDDSTAQRLVFDADFHHMDENGSYDGWSEHKVIVTPCLMHGFRLRVTGRDRDGIKDYIAETFHFALTQPAPGAA